MLEELRAIGLPMGSKAHGAYISWTTNAEKAQAARELGARVTTYISRDPLYSGWEVSCHENVVPITVARGGREA